MAQRGATKPAWTTAQVKYQESLANPLEKRTEEEIAKDVGVERTTLWRWRQLDGFMDAVRQMVKDASKCEYPRVIKALGRSAQQGDVPAIKLFLQWHGDLVEKSEQKTDGPPPVVNVTIGTADGRTD